MGEIVNIKKPKYEIEYIFKDDKVVAITHPLWGFRIMRKGDKIALVCEDNDEPFGEIDADVFNTILVCWLLIDSPETFDEAKNNDN